MYLGSVALFGYDLRLAVLMFFVLALPLVLVYGLVLLLLLVDALAREEARKHAPVTQQPAARFPPPSPKPTTGEIDLDALTSSK
jgi:hypothetical protein